MTQVRTFAALALICVTASAHAEHFQYDVNLSGMYSDGGTDGCYPPDFNQPACPREGTRTATFSFDTPTGADGSFLVEGNFGDITDFQTNLGGLAQGPLFGGVNLYGGVANGVVQTSDGLETFTFDWATRSATYIYDYLDHNPWGNFKGTLSAVPEPGSASTFLAGLLAMAIGIAIASRRRSVQ
jgi:hypothetical protein